MLRRFVVRQAFGSCLEASFRVSWLNEISSMSTCNFQAKMERLKISSFFMTVLIFMICIRLIQPSLVTQRRDEILSVKADEISNISVLDFSLFLFDFPIII